MGESVTEGSIVEWRVKPGEWIDEGATLVEVTTDKVDVEVPAPASGVVTRVLAAEGAAVAVGATIAEIDPTAPRPATPAKPPAAAPAPPAPAGGPSAAAGASSAPAGVLGAGPSPRTNGAVKAVASHRAQRMAERERLDLGRIAGTGPGGMIVLRDVAAAAASAAPPVLGGAPRAKSAIMEPPLSAGATLTPLRGPAATLVDYMEASLSVPTATSFRTLSVGRLDARRAELNAALRAAGRSEKISYTHLIAYALVRAAHNYPAITAIFRRNDGVPSRATTGVHLGLAVDATRKDGSRFLVVPALSPMPTRSILPDS